MTQGERIKTLRKSSKINLTLEKFGEKLGVGKTAISKIEKDERGLTNQMLLSICREFNVNEEWLRTGDGEMFKERPPEDEVASYVEDLLDHEEEENPFYDIIIEMMRTYHDLDTVSQQAALNYFRLLKKNLEHKKEG